MTIVLLQIRNKAAFFWGCASNKEMRSEDLRTLTANILLEEL